MPKSDKVASLSEAGCRDPGPLMAQCMDDLLWQTGGKMLRHPNPATHVSTAADVIVAVGAAWMA